MIAGFFKYIFFVAITIAVGFAAAWVFHYYGILLDGWWNFIEVLGGIFVASMLYDESEAGSNRALGIIIVFVIAFQLQETDLFKNEVDVNGVLIADQENSTSRNQTFDELVQHFKWKSCHLSAYLSVESVIETSQCIKQANENNLANLKAAVIKAGGTFKGDLKNGYQWSVNSKANEVGQVAKRFKKFRENFDSFSIQYTNGFYVGGKKAAKQNGFGMMLLDSGESYKGYYKADKKNGFGILVWPDGDQYIGHFSNGSQSGNEDNYIRNHSSHWLERKFALGSNNKPASQEEFKSLQQQLVKQLKQQDYEEALASIQKLRLSLHHLPNSIDYFEGKAWYESGKEAKAYQLMKQYMTKVGSSGKYYQKATSYLSKAESSYKSKTRLYKKQCIQKCVGRWLPSYKEGDFGGGYRHVAESCDATEFIDDLESLRRSLAGRLINKNLWQNKYYRNIVEQKKIMKELRYLPHADDFDDNIRRCNRLLPSCQSLCATE